MNNRMKIKWERNSRVLALAAKGKISNEDIIPRTNTSGFPPEMATVRMSDLSNKFPRVTVHIRGKSKQRAGWLNQTYEVASTCRVNLDREWGMTSNGELDKDLTWLDVHNAVEEVKETMGI